MKVQKFVVTIESGDRDGCGNPIPAKTEGYVRRVLADNIEGASSISVEEVKEG